MALCLPMLRNERRSECQRNISSSFRAQREESHSSERRVAYVSVSSFLPLSAGPRESRSSFYIRESEREAIVEDTLVAAGHEERV